jgi:hypothetical protein
MLRVPAHDPIRSVRPSTWRAKTSPQYERNVESGERDVDTDTGAVVVEDRTGRVAA